MNNISETNDQDLEDIFGNMDAFIKNNCSNIFKESTAKIEALVEEAKREQQVKVTNTNVIYKEQMKENEMVEKQEEKIVLQKFDKKLELEKNKWKNRKLLEQIMQDDERLINVENLNNKNINKIDLGKNNINDEN